MRKWLVGGGTIMMRWLGGDHDEEVVGWEGGP